MYKKSSKAQPKRLPGVGSNRIVMQHRKLLREILKHQVANLGYCEHEFYSCYTYEHGEMPPWVAKAKALLHNARTEPPASKP